MRRKHPLRIPVCLLLLICLFTSLIPWALAGGVPDAEGEATPTPVPTAAVPKDIAYPGLTLEAEIGYDGRITYLRKLPLRVTLINQGENLSGTLAVNVYRNREEYDRYEIPVSIASQAEVQEQLLVELTTKQKEYQVEFLVGGKVIASQTVTPSNVMDPSTMLVATLSEKNAPLSQFIFSNTKDPLKRGEQWQVVPLEADNFPEDSEMMEAFAFLAVDGVDLSALNPRQQAALAKWLEDGGIAIVGGGAQAALGFPFFSQFTGITAGGTAQSAEDITPSLLSYVKAAEPALGSAKPETQAQALSPEGAALLTELKNAKNPLVFFQETGLLDMTRVGDGVVFTAAFSLSDKPLSDWLSTTAFWQRVLITAMGDRYKKISELYSNYYRRSNTYIDGNVIGQIPLPNDSSFLLPLVLLLVFVVLVGFGSYWFLKKKDKRDLMWATIPALSILFVALLLLMGNTMAFRRPVASLAGIVIQDAEGTLGASAMVGLSVAENGPVTISSQPGEIRVAQESYYDDSEPPRTHRLRYVYRQGPSNALTFPESASRTVRSFFVEDLELPKIQIQGDCRWEKDGLRVTVVNQGEYPLQAGHVITPMGYCAVPALLPGETADRLIAYAKEEDQKAQGQPAANAYGNIPISEGVLISASQQQYTDVYSMVSAIVYPEDFADSKTQANRLSNEERERRSLQSNLYNYAINNGNWYEERAFFYYLTLDDGLFSVNLTANGEAVKRTAQRDVIGARIQYHALSPEGTMHYLRGMIPVFEAKEEKNPVAGVQITERYRYYRLQDKPMFCFAIPQDARNAELTLLELGVEYSYAESDLYIWNAKTGEWKLMDPKKSLIKQLDWKDCLTRDGELFVQYAPSTSNGDGYAEIASPYLVLEGSVR